MIKHEDKILVAFNTTTAAMAMEKYCKKHDIEGRLIPLPKSISAGCGMSWISPLRLKNIILEVLANNDFEFSNTYEMEI